MTDSHTWIMIASTCDQSFRAQTTINDSELIYRALSKWLVRGGASNLLEEYWEHIDQHDNELEDALLDQFVTQAETNQKNPQITNVRTKDYSIDITVHPGHTSESLKTCTIDLDLYVYFGSLNKKIRIEKKTLNLTLMRCDKLEKVLVTNAIKTPAYHLKESKRVSKRNSKVTRNEKSVK